MTSKNIRRSLLPSLMAVAGMVMACIIYAEIRARPTIQNMASSQGAAEIRIASLPKPRQAMPAKISFATIIERPLFSPSRRPPSEDTTAASVPSLGFSLSGVVISTDEPFALVKPDATGDPVRIKVGEELSGWTVARIEADRILVRHDTVEKELLLDFSAPAPLPPEAAMPKDAPTDGQAGTPANQQSNGENKAPDSEQASQSAPPPEADEPAPAGQNEGN
jgi:hypothetical protein